MNSKFGSDQKLTIQLTAAERADHHRALSDLLANCKTKGLRPETIHYIATLSEAFITPELSSLKSAKS